MTSVQRQRAAPAAQAALLRVDDLAKSYGGVHAVAGVSFDVPRGRITGLIGPNGAGKSTALGMIAGAIKPTANQPVTGFGNGWRAAGGSPIVVANGESLDTISQRYGVPASALLKVNGFTSASQVHGGVRLIVPVYDAAGKSASAEAPESPALKPAAKKPPHGKAEEAKADKPDPKAKDKLAHKKPKPGEVVKPVAEAKPPAAIARYPARTTAVPRQRMIYSSPT